MLPVSWGFDFSFGNAQRRPAVFFGVALCRSSPGRRNRRDLGLQATQRALLSVLWGSLCQCSPSPQFICACAHPRVHALTAFWPLAFSFACGPSYFPPEPPLLAPPAPPAQVWDLRDLGLQATQRVAWAANPLALPILLKYAPGNTHPLVLHPGPPHHTRSPLPPPLHLRQKMVSPSVPPAQVWDLRDLGLQAGDAARGVRRQPAGPSHSFDRCPWQHPSSCPQPWPHTPRTCTRPSLTRTRSRTYPLAGAPPSSPS